ncbi:Dirigent protein [Rhynchospora pubera]|uniref:Dirigent protein n=1 Tax=Rhynchospora pubera TaxID=906938 RepID=A0AAV8CTS1_9POAL|nr:Dirigent protein [Rhynchospora pubera]
MAMSNSLYLLCLLLLLPFSSISAVSIRTLEEKQTHIKLYFHEIISGPNETSFIVAGPNLTSQVFGDIVIFDSALREGPDPSSKLIGLAQGTSISTSQSDSSILSVIYFVFTHGRYNGSTIAIFGRVPASGTAERTVIEGSGLFRMARGYTISSVVNVSSDSFIIEFNFHLLHY